MKQYGEPVFGTVAEEFPVVTTTHGKVMGATKDGVAIFRGIPYGGDCDGERRFLPPQPAQDWEGVKDCRKNGPYAAQLGTSIGASMPLGPYFSGGEPERFGVLEEEQSENCLVLNVLTPELPGRTLLERTAGSERTTVPRKPVLVYLHGGGFATNSGSMAIGADRWVREEDFVVVSVNHRLGIFGFLYLGAFDKTYAESGMAGMLDLVLALEWVRDNITAFGGDPGNVTIMGESGGGMKVSTLLAMKKAKGLFHKAIVESGSSVVGRLSKVEATEKTLELIEKLRLSREEPGQELVKRLVGLPAEELIRVSIDAGLMGFSPVADEINLSYNPRETHEALPLAEGIPLLVGSSEDELAVFCAEAVQDITWDNIQKRLQEGMDGMMQVAPMSPEQAKRALQIFRAEDKKNDSAEHLYLKIQSFRHMLGGGAYYQAEAHAKLKHTYVYHYMVAYDMPHPSLEGKRYAWHTADLPLQMRIVLHKECDWLSKKMAQAWAAFIRTGNPSTKELRWEAFDLESKQIMIFDEQCRIETDPYQNLRECLKKEKL